jgi:hypothetical protein
MRMHAAQDRELAKPCCDLGRPDQRCSGNRLRRRRAGPFEQSRHVRRHGTGDEPTGSEDERQQQHLPIRFPANAYVSGMRDMDRPLHAWQHQPIERHAEHKIERGPDQARFAPAQRVVHERGERPAHRRGKSGE